MRPLELVGSRFGRLVVVSRAANNVSGQSHWNCRCNCGENRVVRGTHLVQGRIESCGCFRKEVFRKPDHLITYNSAHYRVKRAKGKPSDHQCIRCGRQAYSWALKHEAAVTYSSEDGPFSGDPNDYVPMCARCHKNYDIGAK